jgi:WD40 repeat protein/tetratricopeptide (TPR) repeat protein
MLKLDQGDPDREERHRVRLGAVAQQCPRLIQVWFPTKGNFTAAAFSADAPRVLLAAEDFVQVCEVTTGQPVCTLKAAGPILAAGLSADGRRVATAFRVLGGSDRAVHGRVWDVATGQAVSPVILLPGYTRTLAFSPDGRRVLIASNDAASPDQQTVVQNFDVSSGKALIAAIRIGSSSPEAALSGDGRHVLTLLRIYDPSGGQRAEVRVWDAATGHPVSRDFKQAGYVYHTELSPDGKRVLMAVDDGTVQLWDVAEGKAVRTIKHGGSVNFASFSREGGRIVSASTDRTARVWDAKTGEPLGVPMKHARWVRRAVFSPEGRRVLTAGGDNTIRLWDAASGEPVTPPVKGGGTFDPTVGFSPDGRYVLMADREARLWDVTRAAPQVPAVKHPGEFRRRLISPDGQRVLTLGDGQARVWELATGAPVTPPLTHPAGWRLASFSPDSRAVVTIGFDHVVRVWEASNGAPRGPLVSHPESIEDASLSPDGQRLAVPVGNTVHVWNVASGAPSCPVIRAGNALAQVRFSPDSSRVLTATQPWGETLAARGARVWDAVTGKAVTPLLKNSEQGAQVAVFSRDGRRILTASRDGTARVWDAATGLAVSPPVRHGAEIVSGTFSPDGRWFATTSRDWTARVWDATTGEPITPSLKHDETVNSCTFSEDGKRVLTSSDDGTARVWRTPTGEPLTPPLRHIGRVEAAWFRADGRRVFTHSAVAGATEGRVWELVPEERRAEDVVAEAHLLASQKLDPTWTLAALEAGSWRKAWEDLRARYPERFTASPRENLAWHHREADASRAASQWAAAIWHLDRLIAADSNDTLLFRRRAVANAELEAWPAALADFTNYLTLNARDADGWHCRGLVHARQGAWDKAAADYAKALELAPTDAPVWLSQFIAHAQQGQREQAEAAWAKAVEHSHLLRLTASGDWSVRPRLGDDDPKPWAEVAATLPEENDEAEGWVGRVHGLTHLAAGEWQKAVEAFAVALASKKDGTVLRARARAYQELSQWDKAVADLTSVLEQKKDDWSVWYLRAKALARRGDNEKVVADASRAIELEPKAGAPLILRGESYLKLKQFEKGMADYAQAVRLGATSNFTPLEQTLLLAAIGDRAGYGRACAALVEENADATEPSNLNNAAWVCVYLPDALPDLAPAVALAEKACGGRKEYLQLNTLAAVLYRAGKVDEALQRFEEAMKLHGKGGMAWDWLFLAMAHHRLGHASEARQWLDKSIAWIQQLEDGKIKEPLLGGTLSWSNRLELQLLTREAEVLLKPPGQDKK